MAKLNFHIKSHSSSTAAVAEEVSQVTPESSKKEQRTPKEYLASLRDSRFFSLRRSQSQKDVKSTTGRATSPFSFSGKLKRNISPKTPQYTSLFSPKLPPRSENSRHHRQYAVSLSHLPHMRAAAMLDQQSITVEPESPSETTRLRRLNPRKSKSPKIPPVIITAPSGDALGLQEIREPLLKSDIVARFMPIPPLDLRTPPSYSSRPREHSGSSSKAASELVSTSKEDTSFEQVLPRQRMGAFQRIVEILQEAARSLDGEPAFSQATIFRYLAPIVVFICVLALGILIPKNYSFIKDNAGISASSFVPIIVLGAIGCSLVLLEGCLRVAGTICQSFCEMDLDAMFRLNEIVDNNGGRIGGADLVTGVFASG